VNKDAVLLGKDEATCFLTITAKLLYLAKRARPDIFTIISFLCTPVTAPISDSRRYAEVKTFIGISTWN
jgi:hypothetical protein